MSNFRPHHYAISCLGFFAEQALGEGRLGCVAAVFKRSFYVDMEGSLVCVGISDLGAGPLNVISSVPEKTDWMASGVRMGDPVSVANKMIHIGHQFEFNLSKAEIWGPPPTPSGYTAKSVDCGLVSIAKLADGRIPQEGLGALILSHQPPRKRIILQLADKPVDRLRTWLQRALPVEKSSSDNGLQGVQAILGLGPGLTPSGDDFLGGMMIALHALDHHEALNRLARTVHRFSTARTTPIAVSHLEAAMEGMGGAPVHVVLNCLLMGDAKNLAPALNRIDEMGHTSGWDTVAGMVTVLRVWQQIECCPEEAASCFLDM